MKSLLLVMMAVVLSACATTPSSTLPDTFTTENIMKLHSGMSSQEVLSLLGTPKNITQTVCGTNHGSGWECTIWDYGQFPYDTASFYFSGQNPSELILNSFKVNRK